MEIEIRELKTGAEMAPVVALQTSVWSVSETVPASHLVVTVHSGGHVLGAFDRAELAGFVYAMPAVAQGESPWLASHMMAVAAQYRDRGVGARLKFAQRDWAMAHGFGRITWTADPLEARNAYLNLNRLGAVGVEYVIDFYGSLSDVRNAGVPSDRLVLEWDVREISRKPKAAVDVKEGAITVPIPVDWQSLRASDPMKAKRTRLEVRDRCLAAFRQGYAAVALERSGPGIVFIPRKAEV